MTDAFRVRLPADLIISGQALEANISKGRVLFLGKVRRVGSCLQVPFGIGVMMTCGVFLPEMEINTEASIKVCKNQALLNRMIEISHVFRVKILF